MVFNSVPEYSSADSWEYSSANSWEASLRGWASTCCCGTRLEAAGVSVCGTAEHMLCSVVR